MERETPRSEKRMRLRYAGACRVCDADLPARTVAVYERDTRTVRCLKHAVDPAGSQTIVDIGVPGASARREFKRRKDARQKRVREKNPRFGGILLALTGEPQSTTSWETGAVGEERVGAQLNEMAGDHLRVLHDRRVPNSRANIDHIVVTRTGIHVVDPKRYAGRPRLRVEGGLIKARVEKLVVGTRDRTTLVDGALRQVELVRTIVGAPVPVRGVLCFVDADWPLIGGSFTTQGIDVLWPKKLYQQLEVAGPLDAATIQRVHEQVARALPPA